MECLSVSFFSEISNSRLLSDAVFAKGQAKTNYLSDAAVDYTATLTHSDLGFVRDSSVCPVELSDHDGDLSG